MATAQQQGFSTKVEIYLEVAGHRLNVAQAGGDSLILRDLIDLPASDAGDAKTDYHH